MKRTLLKIVLAIILIVIIYFANIFIKQFFHHLEKKKYIAGLTMTASPNVHVLKDTISIDYLNENRTLRIYLPPDYHEDTLRYPVVYFLDGNSLFDDMVLKGPEWQLDEVMDSLSLIGGKVSIVVGIDNSEKRYSEYKPFKSTQEDEGQANSGDQHAERIATQLKTWVDSTYRTKPEANNTVIGGASLGGLMSYYIIASYPEIFGRALVFSPSLWVNKKVFDLHTKIRDLSKLKIYINIGEDEDGSMVPNAKKLSKLLLKDGMPEQNLKFEIMENMGHWHPTWRAGFKSSYPWIME